MLYCGECNRLVNVIVNTPADHNKIYVDTECPKCGVRYTGTLKRMQTRRGKSKQLAHGAN